MTRLLLPLAAVFVLAACDSGTPAAPSDDDRSAEGQVQGGTVSDAMLPLDTVTSTPPAMRPVAPTGDGATGDAAASEPDAATAEGGEDAPQPQDDGEAPAADADAAAED